MDPIVPIPKKHLGGGAPKVLKFYGSEMHDFESNLLFDIIPMGGEKLYTPGN